jgi:nucleoside-triphosphatase
MRTIRDPVPRTWDIVVSTLTKPRVELRLMHIKGRVALTGRPGVGKTTLIERVIDALPVPAGGMVTREIRRCGHRVGFAVIDVGSGEEGVLAHLHQPQGPKVGRYRVNLRDLESIGVAAIERSLKDCRFTIIDEIAPMEVACPRFVPLVEQALESDVGLLISTHAHLQHPIVHRVRQELDLVRIRWGNRDDLVEAVLGRLTGAEGEADAPSGSPP